jgi:arsenite methyltransferase
MDGATDQIKAEIKDRKDRFVKVALEPQSQQRHPTGPASAKGLGYDAAEIEAPLAQATEFF